MTWLTFHIKLEKKKNYVMPFYGHNLDKNISIK